MKQHCLPFLLTCLDFHGQGTEDIYSTCNLSYENCPVPNATSIFFLNHNLKDKKGSSLPMVPPCTNGQHSRWGFVGAPPTVS